MDQLVTTRRGAGLIVYGLGVGFVFSFTALAISAIAFPLLLDRKATTFTAIITSIRAISSNFLVMGIWGLTVAGWAPYTLISFAAALR